MNKQPISLNNVADDSQHSDEIDLVEVFAAIWRGKWWIAFTTIVALGIGGYYAFVIAKPQFVASVDLAIEARTQNVVDIESVLSGAGVDDASVNTELVILKSRILLERLVQEMDLKNDPRFNTALQPDTRPELLKALIDQIRALRGSNATTDDSSEADEALTNKMVSKLRRTLATTAKPNTYVYSLTFNTKDANLSTELANTLAALYLQNQVDIKASATQKAVDWLAIRVQELEMERKSLLREIDEVRSTSSFVSEEILEGSRIQSVELRQRRTDTISELNILADEIAILEQFIETKDFQLLENERSYNFAPSLLNRAIDGDSLAQSQLSQAILTLLSQRRTQLDRMTSQNQTLETSIAQLQSKISADRAAEARLIALSQEAEIAQILYDSFFTRLRETTIQLGLLKPDSVLVSHAILGEQVGPRKARILAMAAILGTVLGIGLVLLRDQRRHRVFLRANELEAHTNLPTMGQIPRIRIRRRNSFIPTLQNSPTSAINEAYRNLRTSVDMSSFKRDPKVIMLTSALPNEGKTSNSVALALHYGAVRKKVLLVECDLRRKTLHQHFTSGALGKQGIVSITQGNSNFEDCIIHNAMPNCDVLLGEPSSINAADFFASSQFSDFLQMAQERYDKIILDTPPVLVVPDARLIGQFADATLFTVSWNNVHREQISAGINQLETVNVSVTGTVLSRIDAKRMKSYGYGGKYSGYGSYGSYGFGYYGK